MNLRICGLLSTAAFAAGRVLDSAQALAQNTDMMLRGAAISLAYAKKFIPALVMLLAGAPAVAATVAVPTPATFEVQFEGLPVIQGSVSGAGICTRSDGTVGCSFQDPVASAAMINPTALVTVGPVAPNGNVLTPQITSSTVITSAIGCAITGNDQVATLLQYNFVVVGPAGQSVPLIFYPRASATADGGGLQIISQDAFYHERAFAQIALVTDLQSEGSASIDLGTARFEVSYSLQDGPSSTTSDTFAFSVPVTVTSGLLQSITMNAQSYVNFSLPLNAGCGGGSAQATVDPYVVIDPSFPLANQFSLVFSPGIANAVPAPTFAGTPGQANCFGQSVSALASKFGGLNSAAAALGYPNVGALQTAIQAFCSG